MEMLYKEHCTYCEGEIIYSAHDKLIKCPFCGTTNVVAEFVREQQRIEQRLAEGEEARAALEEAKQEKQKAQEALTETIKSLGSIRTDQQVQAENLKQLLEGQQADQTIQNNMLQLLQLLQGGQQEEQNFLNGLLKNVSAGKKTVDEKLAAISEVAVQLLQNQSETEEMIRALSERITGSDQEKKRLIEEFTEWNKRSHKEDLERLEEIRNCGSSMEGYNKRKTGHETSTNDLSNFLDALETDRRVSSIISESHGDNPYDKMMNIVDSLKSIGDSGLSGISVSSDDGLSGFMNSLKKGGSAASNSSAGSNDSLLGFMDSAKKNYKV